MSSAFLMCRPDFFEVAYVINPWMEGNVHRALPENAQEQWDRLAESLTQFSSIQLIAPQPGLPDMTFTANAGFVWGRSVVLSSFLPPQRQGEEAHFAQWFRDQGFEVLIPPMSFEGAGDALVDRSGQFVWAGFGHRSLNTSHDFLRTELSLEVVSLELIDPRFYHLDTCFCPLEGGFLLYYPPAFSESAQAEIAGRVPTAKRIVISETDAFNFACNAVNVGDSVVLNRASEELVRLLGDAGFHTIQCPLSEFMKAGGSAKCLTLRLTEPLTSSVLMRGSSSGVA